MKPGKLLLMVLVLLLGMAVAAPAVTIQTPWKSGPKEENLYQIITAWGFPVDNETLQHAFPLESLSPDNYLMKHYARDPGKSLILGIYPLALTPPGRGDQPPAHGIQLLNPEKSANWECDITFSAISDFGFFAATQKPGILLTTQNQNSASSPNYQSSGLIFDLGEINPHYRGQYIVAFEAERSRPPFGDLDYTDLVIQVETMPLPGTLTLAGGGLLCLFIFRFCQRRFAAAG
jgi:hypothetical protein